MSVDFWIYTVIGVTILFYVLAALVPEAQTAGQSLNTSGVPLGGLFGSGGVVFLILMAAVIIGVVRALRMGK